MATGRLFLENCMDASLLNDPAAKADYQRLTGLPQDQMAKTVLVWLTGKHERRSALAVAILAHGGAAAPRLLIAEALAKGKREGYRVRMLQAIERVGHPLDPDQLFELMPASLMFGPAVCEQITRLLAWNRQASADRARAAAGEAPGSATRSAPRHG